jgi:hypothetical protein
VRYTVALVSITTYNFNRLYSIPNCHSKNGHVDKQMGAIDWGKGSFLLSGMKFRATRLHAAQTKTDPLSMHH